MRGEYSYVFEKTKNYIISTVEDIEEEEYSLKVGEDGRISFIGSNSGKSPITHVFCSGDATLFPKGEYRYYDGERSRDGIYSRIHGID